MSALVQVHLDVDEWYPVYSVVDDGHYAAFTVEATEEQVARWKRACAEFERAQDEMAAADRVRRTS